MCTLDESRPDPQGAPKSGLRRRLLGGATRFMRDEAGDMSILTIFASLGLMTMGGIGIDLMHAEMRRNVVQNTLDRAVLAAADLDQTLDAKGVVRDYFDKMDMADALTFVDPKSGLNYRKVTAKAHVDMPANFTRLLGIDTLIADGIATAEEHIQNVEVSMVLDISGSMGDPSSSDPDDTKLDDLKAAAKTFVDTVLGGENADRVSISLIPYSEHVNAGPLITDGMKYAQYQNYSHCVEFSDSDFKTVALDLTKTYPQMQHYQWNYPGWNDLNDTICPRWSYERIQPWTNDSASLKAQIDLFQPRAGTSIFLGMKWGAALLDPSTKPLNTKVIAARGSAGGFPNRPAPVKDEETLKTVVLMTDGENDNSYRISNWAYDSYSDVAHWANYNLWYHLRRNVSQRNWSAFYYKKYSPGIGDMLLDDICDAAKADGIVIWGVGFEVTDHGASVLENCASSPAHFFRVEGTEIETAFHAIARSINQLRLTQ